MDMGIKLTPRGEQSTQPFRGRVRASMNVAAVDRRPDGTTLLELTLTDVRTDPERAGAPLQGGKLRLAIAPDGRVTDVEGTGGVFSIAGVDPGSLLGGGAGAPADTTSSQVLFPQFPTNAIEPGDTWSRTSTAPLPFGEGSVEVQTDGRFEGYTNSPLGRAAKIGLTITTPIDYTVSLAELTKATAESGAPVPTPAPPDGRIVLDGRTVTASTAVVLPGTSDLVRLDGKTTMTVQMAVEGVPADQLRGAPANYAFDATITMSIVRV